VKLGNAKRKKGKKGEIEKGKKKKKKGGGRQSKRTEDSGRKQLNTRP